MQIVLKGLGYTFVDKIFSDVDLTISDTDRLGIVGNNGAGKSTLLKCISGALTDYDGQVITPKNFRFGIVEQILSKSLVTLTFRSALNTAIPEGERSYSDWKVDATLEAFKVPAALCDRPLNTLSGGWQRLAQISRLAISMPDIMVLDEPTNHLDLEKIIALEKWLTTIVFDVPLIIVSHDREFLNNCTNRTLFMRNGNVTSFQYSYGRAKELLHEKDNADVAQRQREAIKLKRLESSAKAQREIGKNNHSDAALQKAKQIEKRVVNLKSQMTEVHIEKRRDITLSSDIMASKRVLSIRDTQVFDPSGNLLIKIDDFAVHKNDRIVLLGPNGVGKSQFIEFIARAAKDEVSIERDNIKFAPTVKIGYADQHLANVPRTATLGDFISKNLKAGGSKSQIAGMMASAGFPFEAQQTTIGKLSQGQIARLNFLALRLAEPNLFLMDEPTNHLDVGGQENLEAEILRENTAAIVISHDRAFVRNIGNRFIEIHNRKLRELNSPDQYFAR